MVESKKLKKAYYAIGGQIHSHTRMITWSVYSSLRDVLIGEMYEVPGDNILAVRCEPSCWNWIPRGISGGCTPSGFHLVIKKDWVQFLPLNYWEKRDVLSR